MVILGEEKEYEKEVLEVAKPKTDKKIKEFANKEKAAMLAIIAPYVPARISPTRRIRAELGPYEEFAVEDFVKKAKDKGCKKLILLLHSFGGGVDSAYVIAKLLREEFEEIITFIPQLAASGATLIALASNKIVLGKLGRLSPIDILIDYGDKIVSSLALIRAFGKLEEKFAKTDPDDISYPYRHLIESIDPTDLETKWGLLDEIESYATELLQKAGYNKEDAEKIAETLVWKFPSHISVIDLDVARSLKLKVESSEIS